VNASGTTSATSGPRSFIINSTAADYDGTTFIDADDFVAFVGDFVLGCVAAADPDPACTRNADIDGSGFVDSDDFSRFVAAFNCPN
jgi:hypothetical protein